MQVPKRKSEEHKFKKPDLHITEARLGHLRDELKKLKTRHPRAAEEVKRLALLGDFSENFAYQMAKRKLRGINKRIIELDNQIKRAIIIKPNKNTVAVQIGHTVTIETAGKQKTYLILGSAETDPSKGIISHNSPIGSALIGKKMGDKINLLLTDKKIEYKIIKISS